MFRKISLVTLGCSFFLSLTGKEVTLYQKDFDHGTYIINQPGTYRLAEDISFNPNSPEQLKTDAYGASFLLPEQFLSQGGKYNNRAFGLGFFAAIVIPGDDVIIDLNGHTIEQSREHSLLQRFFAVIELANQPFIPGQGPHDFGIRLNPGKNVVIKNGTIGRSSHHGIHGNNNVNIRIENVNFRDFEVAAVSLNAIKGLHVENCRAESRKDLPVLGSFSSARFIQRHLDYLARNQSSTTLNIGGKNEITVDQARQAVRKAINAVHEDIIIKGRSTIDPVRHPEEYALFHNSAQVVDGNCYGFLINSFGQAVEGFPFHGRLKPQDYAMSITFKNVHVDHLVGKVNEIIALEYQGNPVLDPVGAVFQLKNVHPDTGEPLTVTSLDDEKAVYMGNLLSNAQALVAKAYYNRDFEESGFDFTRLTISRELIDWIETDPNQKEATLSHFVTTKEHYICNADLMFHVNKGVIGFKMDGGQDIVLDNTSAKNIENQSIPGSEVCGFYEKSHPRATLFGAGGPKTRGYSFAGSSNVNVSNSQAINIVSASGTAVGFDILTDSHQITIKNCFVEGVRAGDAFTPNQGPNKPPKAVGFRLGPFSYNTALVGVCAKDLKGFAGESQVLDESKKSKVSLNCD